MKISITTLQIILIILKFLGAITWPWWIVLFPALCVLGFILLILCIVFLSLMLDLTKMVKDDIKNGMDEDDN